MKKSFFCFEDFEKRCKAKETEFEEKLKAMAKEMNVLIDAEKEKYKKKFENFIGENFSFVSTKRKVFFLVFEQKITEETTKTIDEFVKPRNERSLLNGFPAKFKKNSKLIRFLSSRIFSKKFSFRTGRTAQTLSTSSATSTRNRRTSSRKTDVSFLSPRSVTSLRISRLSCVCLYLA